MATTPISNQSNPWAGAWGTDATIISWLAMPNGNDGAPAGAGGYSDKSIQVTGTFGAGGTVIAEGSNDGGTTWFPLTDPTGTAISFTSAGGKAITEAVGMFRPRVTGGDGTTAINVFVLMVRH